MRRVKQGSAHLQWTVKQEAGATHAVLATHHCDLFVK